MKDLLQLIFSGFWTFIGAVILLGMLIDLPLKLWSRWLRSRNIKNAGWPPPHLDADGDFKEKEEPESEST